MSAPVITTPAPASAPPAQTITHAPPPLPAAPVSVPTVMAPEPKDSVEGAFGLLLIDALPEKGSDLKPVPLADILAKLEPIVIKHFGVDYRLVDMGKGRSAMAALLADHLAETQYSAISAESHSNMFPYAIDVLKSRAAVVIRGM